MMKTDIQKVIAQWNKQIANVPHELRESADKAITASANETAKRLRKAAPLGPGPPITFAIQS